MCQYCKVNDGNNLQNHNYFLVNHNYFLMPPKRNVTEKNYQATVQDAEEILTSSGGRGVALGISTDQGLTANKLQFLETVLDGSTNKFILQMDSNLLNFDMKITKHLSSIEANVAVLKSQIVDLRERQVNLLNLIEDLITRVDDLEQKVLEQGNKTKILREQCLCS